MTVFPFGTVTSKVSFSRCWLVKSSQVVKRFFRVLLSFDLMTTTSPSRVSLRFGGVSSTMILPWSIMAILSESLSASSM